MSVATKESPLLKLESFGQSVWLDYIDRPLIRGGRLRKLIDEDGVSGVTSNPAIFDKAITGSHEYDGDIARFVRQGKRAAEILELLMVEDIGRAADEFRKMYDSTDGRNGFVSIEVSPHLAYDTDGTIDEARRMWKSVNRPNIFIKIPATTAGLPAIRQCIGEGINVNITLLFGLGRYQQVAQAYVEGLEMLAQAGKPLDHVSSVASFFLSRIDSLVDPMLEEIIAEGGPASELAPLFHGQTAVACAKAAYQLFKEIFSAPRFQGVSRNGARVQRLLWASTGTKNPSYSDVKYIESLIGPDTVNTLPMETLNAFRNHGRAALTLEQEVDQANHVLARLGDLDIGLIEIARRLEEEGVRKFIEPYDRLIESIKAKGAKE